MKKTFFFTLLFVAFSIVPYSTAQKSAVTTAVVKFETGDFDQALEKLNTALENSSQLDDKTKAKAWLYKGKTLISLLSEAAHKQDIDKLTKYEMAYYDAYLCFEKSTKFDSGGRLTSQIKNEVGRAYNGILQLALGYLNGKDYKNALIYTDAAVSANNNYINKDAYIAYDLRAQTHLALGDSSQALLDFNDCIARYNKSKPEKPDLLIAYAYYRLALLYRYQKSDLDAALGSLQEGANLLDTEFDRVKALKTQYSPENFNYAQQQYMSAKQDLQSFELDIYLNFPDKYVEAIERFRKAVANEPKNVLVRVAYASLLEKSDPNAALVEYNKALELDPNNMTATFNAGAVYVNKATAMYQEANMMDDFQAAGELMKTANAKYAKALPYLKKAHELEPMNKLVIQTLKQITLQLEMNEEYQHYKKLESEL